MFYEILPHTADLRIRAEGATVAELFREMLRGMATAMQPTTNNQRPTTRRAIRLSAPDREALLVDFLNEAIYLADTNSEAYDDIAFEKLTDTEMDAELVGRPREEIGLQVKAATHHDLRIEEKDGAFSATVVFDI